MVEAEESHLSHLTSMFYRLVVQKVKKWGRGDCSLDKKTRGFIESSLNEIFSDEKIVGDVEWVQEEMPISSLRDLALGYAIGVSKALGMTIAQVKPHASEKELKEAEEIVDGIIKRRLPEFIKKIERELGR